MNTQKLQAVIAECLEKCNSPEQSRTQREIYDQLLEYAMKELAKRQKAYTEVSTLGSKIV